MCKSAFTYSACTVLQEKYYIALYAARIPCLSPQPPYLTNEDLSVSLLRKYKSILIDCMFHDQRSSDLQVITSIYQLLSRAIMYSVTLISILAGVAVSAPMSTPGSFKPTDPLAFDATYGPSPKPFRINLKPDFTEWLHERVASARYVASDLGVPDFSEGPSLANATATGKYWVETYDWEAQQEQINDL